MAFDENYDAHDEIKNQALFSLVDKILPFLFTNGDEISAVDLLQDIEQLPRLAAFVNKQNYKRIFEYLLHGVNYASDDIE